MTNLTGVELEHKCGLQDSLARIAREELHDVFKDIGNRFGVYVFKSRLKGVNEIYKKVIRIRKERETKKDLRPYNPGDVPDAWGGRFVALLQVEIPEVFEEILGYLAYGQGDNELVKLTRVSYFSHRPSTDRLSIESEVRTKIAELKARGKKSINPEVGEFDNRASGYSSLHLELIYSIDRDFGGGMKRYEVPFEIQIRDVFEEGWGEISHRIAYKADTTNAGILELRSSFRRPPTFELLALKSSADALSQQAGLLDRNAGYFIDALSQALSWRAASDIDSDANIILTGLIGAKADIREHVVAAYNMMKAAQESYVKDVDNEESRKYYSLAAASFQSAVTIAEKGDPQILRTRVQALHGMTIGYHLLVELGNAIVRSIPHFVDLEAPAATEVLKRLEFAIACYGRLWADGDLATKESKRSAILALRLGQALKRLPYRTEGDLKRAEDMLRTARQLAETDPHTSELGIKPWLLLQVDYDLLWCRHSWAHLRKVSCQRLRKAWLEMYLEELEAVVAGARRLCASARELGDQGKQVHLAHKCLSVSLKLITEYLYIVKAVRERRKIAQEKGKVLTGSDRKINELVTADELDGLIATLRHRPYSGLIGATTETIGSIIYAYGYLNKKELRLQMAEMNFQKLSDIARVRLSKKSIGARCDGRILDVRVTAGPRPIPTLQGSPNDQSPTG